MLVNTLFQKVDVFTKAVAGSLWENAMKILSILKTYDVLHTSSTGLKMSLGQAWRPMLGRTVKYSLLKRPHKWRNQNQEIADQSGFHNTKKPSRTTAPAMCLPNELSFMSLSTEVMVDECHLGSGVIREGGAEITRMNPTRSMHVHIT